MFVIEVFNYYLFKSNSDYNVNKNERFSQEQPTILKFLTAKPPTKKWFFKPQNAPKLTYSKVEMKNGTCKEFFRGLNPGPPYKGEGEGEGEKEEGHGVSVGRGKEGRLEGGGVGGISGG